MFRLLMLHAGGVLVYVALVSMPFSFNTPSQYTLLNLRPITFGLKLAALYFANPYLLHYLMKIFLIYVPFFKNTSRQ